MEANPDHPHEGFETENTGGLLSGFLADEDDVGPRSRWRLGAWGVGAVVAVLLAVLASQSAFRINLDQVASDDLARQAQQLRTIAKESQNEARRLASAVETLSSDRDRLYARVAVLEQGLDSVTGSIARQQTAATATPAASAGPQSTPAAAPAIAPVQTTAAAVTSAAPAGSGAPAASPALPDAAAAKLTEPEAPAPEAVGSIPPAADTKPGVQRPEFAVELGTGNSLSGLRTLWRGLAKSNTALAALHPVVAVKDGNRGRGAVLLRLIAGPLSDATAAAKLCAALTAARKTCATTVFDGQRLAMQADEPQAAVIKPAPRRRSPASARPLNALFGRR